MGLLAGAKPADRQHGFGDPSSDAGQRHGAQGLVLFFDVVEEMEMVGAAQNLLVTTTDRQTY